MHLSENKRLDLLNVERQARWFIGFFHRNAQRIIDEPANDRKEKP